MTITEEAAEEATVDDAGVVELDELDLLWVAEEQLSLRWLELRAGAALPAEIGAAMLDATLNGDSGGDVVAGVLAETTHLRGELDAVATAIDEARRRRVIALQARWEVQAAALGQEAVDVDAEADRLEKRTNKLLAELAAHEGCGYVPACRVQEMLPGSSTGALEVTQVPRTEALRNEAAVARARALELKVQQLRSNGGAEVSLADVDDYLLGRRASIELLPSVPDVHGWIDGQASAIADRQRQATIQNAGKAEHTMPNPSAVTLSLHWAGGVLDRSRSKVNVG